ncbi:HAD-IIIA family hydrolase [Candidatus Fermentibacteria bacterium]|nr:HAD-IIIA family hydrolase [Candidatus Fermentibacteria bacterium]
MKASVFLDRDGVINHDLSDYVRTLEDWEPIDGAFGALARLTRAGHPLVVVTNQSAVARGYTSKKVVEEIHRKMIQRAGKVGAEINAVYYCPHAPGTECDCRKPKTGMVDRARDELSLPPGGYLIGDAASDMELGRRAGLLTVMVLTGRGRSELDRIRDRRKTMPWKIAADLIQAVDIILDNEDTGGRET